MDMALMKASARPLAFFLLVFSTCISTGCQSDARDAEAIVRSSLNDPYSAEFSGTTHVAGNREGRIACGIVNAKNAFGGYVGASPFMIRHGRLYLPRESAEADAISTCCSASYRNVLWAEIESPKELPEACDRLPDGVPVSWKFKV